VDIRRTRAEPGSEGSEVGSHDLKFTGFTGPAAGGVGYLRRNFNPRLTPSQPTPPWPSHTRPLT
jgi:hypothetical protein